MDIDSFQSVQAGAVHTPPADTHCTLSRGEPPPPTRRGRTPRMERSDPAKGLGWLHLIGPGTLPVAPHLHHLGWTSLARG